MGMLENMKRRRAARRITAGDGRPLRPFRWWQVISGRKLFYLPATAGESSKYAIDIRFWGKQGWGKEGSDDGIAHLFRDGRHHAQSRLPARFPLEAGTVEVSKSGFGLKRVHYVRPDGREMQLVADPKSTMGRRLRFDQEHPALSRAVGAVSVVMLIVGIGLNLLQLMEPMSQIPPILEHVGPFESPLHLPLWLNITLAFGTAVASMERALRLRYHWLLDAAGN